MSPEGQESSRNNAPLEDKGTVSAADVVCDLCSVALVVHKKDVHLLDIADEELLVAVGKQVTGLWAGDAAQRRLKRGGNVTFLLLP